MVEESVRVGVGPAEHGGCGEPLDGETVLLGGERSPTVKVVGARLHDERRETRGDERHDDDGHGKQSQAPSAALGEPGRLDLFCPAPVPRHRVLQRLIDQDDSPTLHGSIAGT